MAVTRIWDIQKRSTRALIDYCTNPEKTEDGQLVSGVNCSFETVNKEFWITKNSYGKTDKILAFHGLQSFNPGEVTPETAHKIGLELAQRIWGERFQVLVCTHTDKAHIHNHFVINSVSFLDGKKYNDCDRTYKLMQRTSDELCREYCLSVIENPKPGKTKHYVEWQAEKQKRPTWKTIIKTDIDRAIQEAITERQFFHNLKIEGYSFKFGKDITVYPIGKERGLKLARNFGEQYTIEAIRRRILTQPIPQPKKESVKQARSKRYRYYGIFPLYKRKSFRALYWHYCYLFQLFPKRCQRTKQQDSVNREDIQKIRNIREEAFLLCKNKIDTIDQLNEFQKELSEQINRLTDERKHLYNRIHRCRDEQQKADYRNQIAIISKDIRGLKRQVFLCQDIVERIQRMKERMQREAQKQTSQRKEKDKSNEHVK